MTFSGVAEAHDVSQKCRGSIIVGMFDIFDSQIVDNSAGSLQPTKPSAIRTEPCRDTGSGGALGMPGWWLGTNHCQANPCSRASRVGQSICNSAGVTGGRGGFVAANG